MAFDWIDWNATACRDSKTGKIRRRRPDDDDKSCTPLGVIDPFTPIAVMLGRTVLIGGGVYLAFFDGRKWRKPAGLLAIAYGLTMG